MTGKIRTESVFKDGRSSVVWRAWNDAGEEQEFDNPADAEEYINAAPAPAKPKKKKKAKKKAPKKKAAS